MQKTFLKKGVGALENIAGGNGWYMFFANNEPYWLTICFLPTKLSTFDLPFASDPFEYLGTLYCSRML